MATNDKKDIDAASGVETTGHEWDGVKELNNPMPRWWLWTFFACIVFALGYQVLFPSWPIPGGHTKGSLGWTKYVKLQEAQEELAAKRSVFLDRISAMTPEQIIADPELRAVAEAGGRAAFVNNCAVCHGTDAGGIVGFSPNLNDDDWLWGGTLADISTTLHHGIRATDKETRFSEMPAFGKDGILSREQVLQVSDFVISLSGTPDWNGKGAEIFKANCVSCHGAEGKGDRTQGAPDLTDAIWLYGGEREQVVYTVTNARNSTMPNWGERLDENTIKQLTVYVHSLGGGE